MRNMDEAVLLGLNNPKQDKLPEKNKEEGSYPSFLTVTSSYHRFDSLDGFWFAAEIINESNYKIVVIYPLKEKFLYLNIRETLLMNKDRGMKKWNGFFMPETTQILREYL